MSRSIAVLVTEGFEDSEYLSPVDALRAAGYAIFNIDVEPGRIVKSRAEQLPLRIDLGIDQARAADYAGLLIPGGRSPGVLRRDPRVLQFVRDCDARRLLIFAICHGPLLLVSAGVVRGRAMTGVAQIADDLQHAGASYEDSPVVVADCQLVTSRTPEDLPLFNAAMLQLLAEHHPPL